MAATEKEQRPRRSGSGEDYRNLLRQTALSVVRVRTRGIFMVKTLIILAGAASLGFAAIAVGGPRIDRGTAAEVSHAIVAGVILGSGAWPYNLSLGPTQTRLILGSADCEGQPQCPAQRFD
jgi:hypothetical protein